MKDSIPWPRYFRWAHTYPSAMVRQAFDAYFNFPLLVNWLKTYPVLLVLPFKNNSVKFMYEYRRWVVDEPLQHFTTDTIDFHNTICNPAFSVWKPDTNSQGSTGSRFRTLDSWNIGTNRNVLNCDVELSFKLLRTLLQTIWPFTYASVANAKLFENKHESVETSIPQYTTVLFTMHVTCVSLEPDSAKTPEQRLQSM